MPGLKGKTAASFPGTSAAPAELKRKEPGMSKPPTPLTLQCALSMDILEQANLIASLALTFLSKTYFRVSGGIASTAGSVVPAAPRPASTNQSVAIRALPSEKDTDLTLLGLSHNGPPHDRSSNSLPAAEIQLRSGLRQVAGTKRY